ncbi:MAG: hypothetical protein R3E61_09945 [Pseudomonadales bacterium]
MLRASKDSKQQSFDVHSLIQLDVDQFYGIEIEEFPAQIAGGAVADGSILMNQLVSEEFGLYFAAHSAAGEQYDCLCECFTH